jgi:hypothetical protein
MSFVKNILLISPVWSGLCKWWNIGNFCGAGADLRPLGVLRMKIVSHNVTNGRWVYYGAVFEIKEEIPDQFTPRGWTRIGEQSVA